MSKQSKKTLNSITLPKTVGLCVDEGEQPEGSFVKLVNFDVIADGTKLRRRNDVKAIDQSIDSTDAECRSIFELQKDDGTKYVILDVDNPTLETTATAPSVKPTLADGGAGTGSASSIGTVSYTVPNGSEELDDMVGVMDATGVAAGYSIVVEIDGSSFVNFGANYYLKDTIKWSKNGGSSWEETGVVLPTSRYVFPFHGVLPPTIRTEGTADSVNSGAYVYIVQLDLGGGAYAYALFGHNVGHTPGGKWTLSGGETMGDPRWISTYTPAGTGGDLNDLTTSGTYTGNEVKQFVVKITSEGTPDKFQYSTDGGDSWNGTDTSITGAAQVIGDGVSVTFTATTGHALGSKWTFTCTPADAPGAGKHYFKYTYQILDDDGNITAETNPSPSNDITIADNHKITFTPTASADETITNIGIYKTTVADTDTYYFVESAENTATPTTIDESDADIKLNAELIDDRAADSIRTRIIMSENVTTGSELEVDTSWTKVKSDLISPDTQPCYATAMDMAFRVDGTNDNLVIEDATTPRKNGVTAPTVAPVLGDTSGGNIESGFAYRVYYTYAYDNGSGYVVESYPSPYAEIDLGGSAINVTVPASKDANVNYIKIYRCLYNSYDNFFEALTTANTTGTYTLLEDDVTISADDIVTDATLNFYEKPPKATYCAWVNNHMFYANLPDVTNGSSIIRPSLIKKPEQVNSDHDIYFDILDGKEITGLGVLNNVLYAFKQNKILYIDPASPFRSEKITNGKGCIAGATIQNIPDMNALIWLSPEGVVIWNGGSDFINISKNRINSIINDMIDNSANWTAKYQTKDRTYHIIGYYRDSDNEIVDHRHLVYHFDTKAWSEYVYKDDDGNYIYEISLGTMTDANSRETMISGYIVDVDGNIIGIWQNNYEPDLTTYPHDTGAGVAIDWMFGDSSGNAYLLTDAGSMTVVSPQDVSTTTDLSSSIEGLMDTDLTSFTMDCIRDAVCDQTNEIIYFIAQGEGSNTDVSVWASLYRYSIIAYNMSTGAVSLIDEVGYFGYKWVDNDAGAGYNITLTYDANGTETVYESGDKASWALANIWIKDTLEPLEKVYGLWFNHSSLAYNSDDDVVYFTTSDDSTGTYGGVFRDKIYRINSPRSELRTTTQCLEIGEGKEIAAFDDLEISGWPSDIHVYGSYHGIARIQYHDGYLYFVVSENADPTDIESETVVVARMNTSTYAYEELGSLNGERGAGYGLHHSFVVDTDGVFYYYDDGTLRSFTISGSTGTDAFAGTTDTFDDEKRWAYNNSGTYESLLLHISKKPFLDYEGRLLLNTEETNEECGIYRQLLTDDTDYFEDKLFGSPIGDYSISNAIGSTSDGFIFFHDPGEAPS